MAMIKEILLVQEPFEEIGEVLENSYCSDNFAFVSDMFDKCGPDPVPQTNWIAEIIGTLLSFYLLLEGCQFLISAGFFFGTLDKS